MRKEGCAGFTILEVLIALTVFSMVMGIVFFVYVQAIRLNEDIEQRANLNDFAQVLMDRMTGELINSLGIVEAQNEELTFINYEGKKIIYHMAEEDLKRNDSSLLGVGIKIEKLVFDYFGNDLFLDENGDSLINFEELDKDENGTLTGEELSKVSLVQIGFTLTKKGKYRTSLQSGIKLRNPPQVSSRSFHEVVTE